MSKSIHEIEVEIRNADGLHMRPAMQFVDLASTFKSEIKVHNEQTAADAKSIMEMTMLGATCGSKLKIRASGSDARQAVQALQELVESRLFRKPPPVEVAKQKE